MGNDLLYQLIERYDTITIFGHVFPDGDCFGSQIGLKEAIKTTFPHKRVYAIGSGLPSFRHLIGHMDQVDDATINSSLAIVVDVADIPRIEDQRFATAAHVFKVDHHIPDQTFGDDQWIDTSMVAVSAMIAGFVFDHKMNLSVKGANALALGLITDTGRFLYGTMDAKLFVTMGKLTEQGADLAKIYGLLYEKSYASMEFDKYVYANYKVSPAGVIYCVFTTQALAQLGVSAVTAGQGVNLLARVKGHPVWVFFCEEDNHVRVEMRSSGPNVQTVATKYGGGGHQLASGARVNKEDVESVISDLERLILKGSEHVGN